MTRQEYKTVFMQWYDESGGMLTPDFIADRICRSRMWVAELLYEALKERDNKTWCPSEAK